LDRVVAEFLATGVDLPAVRYLAPGDSVTIAYDGEALMVNLDWVGLGQPGGDRSGVPSWPNSLRAAQFAVSILREAASLTDTGEFPSPDAIAADAQTSMLDASTLQLALLAVRDGCQHPGGWLGPGTPVVIGRVQTVGPQGTVMAAVGTVQAVLM
jgi:hypothetical protein